VGDIRNRVANMVSNSKCADFIKNLISGTSTDKNPAISSDALKLFDAIRGQGGGHVVIEDGKERVSAIRATLKFKEGEPVVRKK
jgi:hypothetical protein